MLLAKMTICGNFIYIFEKYVCTLSMQFFLKVLLYLCTSWEDLLKIVGIIPFSFLGSCQKHKMNIIGVI